MKPYSNSLPGFNAGVMLLAPRTEGYSPKYSRIREGEITLAQGKPCPPCTPCTWDASLGWHSFCYEDFGPIVGCIPELYECTPPDISGCSAYCEQTHRYCCPGGIGSPGCCVQYRACCAGF